MPDYTTNLHLKKPLPEDPYNIADANDNMDLLDAAVHTGDAALSGHLQDAAPHNATATATASKIVVRDANGRAAFATPAVASEAANKGYVDGLTQGIDNASILLSKLLICPIDTRSMVITAWSSTNDPTHIDWKNGSIILASADVIYNSDGHPSSVVFSCSGKTITYTLYWNGDQYGGYTKAVA